MTDKKSLTERDICTKFITPAITGAGWDNATQIREEVYFTAGRIYVKGRLTARGKASKADYILYYKPNIPIAIIEAKDNNHTVGQGMQQALDYATKLDIPCVFSSNGDGFLFHDKTATGGKVETEIGLSSFPSPDRLWEIYKRYKGISETAIEKIASQDYFVDNTERAPRYYQQIAINRTVEAIAKGQNRLLLVMATGTGKTYTAFQIIYRLWKSGTKKRILFLADRNALIDQTARGDFRHFGNAMKIIRHRDADPSYQIYLALYQGLTSADPDRDVYKEFSRDFFDLVIVDECHRGSANEDSKWREILEYFSGATHIGMTATPKETKTTSNIEYFNDPIYTYSLKQGIDDGFLAPYKVIKVSLDIDLEGWRPPKGFLDKNGNEVEDRIYNRSDFDKNIIVDERRALVARKISEYLKAHDRYAKTIAFCIDIEHAEGMRQYLVNENQDMIAANSKYIMRITGDDNIGKLELDTFKRPGEKIPAIATTSKLLTTGVDIPDCRIIVLDSNIQSMTEFKQIIGRGTRICEDPVKEYFTIIDFRNVTDLFADPAFDGDPVMIKQLGEDDEMNEAAPFEEGFHNEIIDEETGEVIEFPYAEAPDGGSVVNEPDGKIQVNGVEVKIINERVQYIGADGKLITEALRDYTRKNILKTFSSLDDFLLKWKDTEKKQIILDELEQQGILLTALSEEVGKELDPFDLVCHVAFGKPPLTRKERANNVKKRNYFTKYGEHARKVLESLLDKYADEGITNIESLGILKLNPLNTLGSPIEILNFFGGKEKYLQALKELETELYKTASA
ncbi:MAG: DEAD/DEAH box helicase family protein [Verrucomicrobia bacterium]|jgi:type I restriction enzyme, R subunit|nr:DEAD/DEAH box helicase family protein [Verrucomicrobiota bacterium]